MSNSPAQGGLKASFLTEVGTPNLQLTLFDRVEVLYNQLAAQSPRLTKEFIEACFDGTKGKTWDEVPFFGSRTGKIPLYPTTSQHADKDTIYIGCATRTHHFSFGQLAYRYSIEKGEDYYTISRKGGGFDPGSKFIISKEIIHEHDVQGPLTAYGGLCFPGGPPSRAVLTEKTTPTQNTDQIEEALKAIAEYLA